MASKSIRKKKSKFVVTLTRLFSKLFQMAEACYMIYAPPFFCFFPILFFVFSTRRHIVV